jgi:hypothetical protein
MIDELNTIKIVVDDELQEMFPPSDYRFISALHIQCSERTSEFVIHFENCQRE